jgi:1-acyl-sn-glycerol-3-phosphate acyltransferase
MRSGSIYEVADAQEPDVPRRRASFREKRMPDRAFSSSEVSEVMRETAAAIEGKSIARSSAASPPRPTAARAKVVVKAAPSGGHCRAGSSSGARRRRNSKFPLQSPARPQGRRGFSFIIPCTIIAGVRSVATYIAVSVYVLFAAHRQGGDDLPLEGHPLHPRPRRRASRLALAGITVRVAAGRTSCSIARRSTRPTIRATSIRLLFTSLHPRMHIVYKAEINAIPLLAGAFRHGGFVLIDRNKEAAMVARGRRPIHPGPQPVPDFSGRNRSKTVESPFKKGGFLMALKAQAPIVPVVSGGRDAMRRGARSSAQNISIRSARRSRPLACR